MKRFISLVLSLMLVLGISTVAFAAGYTLTINNSTTGHDYEAYQIFSGTLETVSGTDTQVLANIEWGSAIVGTDYDNSAALLAAINAAATAAPEGAPIKHLAGVKDAAELAEKMADNITTDSETLDAIAVIFEKHIKEGAYAGVSTYADSKYTISGLTAGYYLVKDQDGSLQGEHDSYTKFILRVIKDETVSPKSSIPEVEKTSNDTVDGTYNEHEDADIGDTVYFKLEGKLPSNLKDYEKYYYKFTDTLPVGLKFDEIQQVYLEGHDGNTVYTFYDSEDGTWADGVNHSVTIVDGKETMVVEFTDIIATYSSVLPTHEIIIKYSTIVTKDAATTTDPITNKVSIEYSNDPNHEGEGTPTGTTTEDTSEVFTFDIIVDKYDADDKNKKLPGAEFILYYERTVNNEIKKYYAKVVTEEMIAAGGKIGDEVVVDADLGTVYGWTENESEASILDTDNEGKINLKGLDGGIYYLKETKAPAGYNLMETPVKVEIIPTYIENGDEVTVNLSYKVDDIEQASKTVGVRNSSGSTLPVTGGIGTTIFYIVGGMLLVGAAIVLITRKRMSTEK